MPIPIISNLVPKNNGTFPTHESTFGKGGWHEVMTELERDLIPLERRKAGMACNVVTTNRTYILGLDLATWGEIVLTGVEDAPATGQAFARQNAEWTDLAILFDGGIYAP